MKIHLLFISVLMLFVLPGFSQSNDWLWAKPVSTTGYCFAESVIIDHQHNSYMAGSFDHYISFGDSAFVPNTYGGTDAFIAKYNQDGGFSWALHFYTTNYDPLYVYENKLELLNDSTFVAFGQFIGTLHIGGQILVGHGGAWNDYLATFSTHGTLLHLYLIGGSNDTDNHLMKADKEGNLFLSVQSSYSGYPSTLHFGSDTSFSLNNSAQFLAKFSPDLNLEWVKEYTSFYDFWWGGSLMTDESGNVTLLITTVAGDIIFNQDTLHPHTEYPAFFHTFNSEGDPVSFHEVPNNSIYFSLLDPDHDIYTYGEIYAHDTLILGQDTILTLNTHNLLLVDYDSLFNIKWYKKIPLGFETLSYYPFQLEGEHVVIGATYENFITFCDTTFSTSSPSEVAFAFYNKNGTCKGAFTTHSNNQFVGVCGFSPDDCNDLILAGDMAGITYFGKDTLNAPNGCFIARFHHGGALLDIGPDTTITNHDSVILSAPPGYDSYLWNTGDTLRSIVVRGSNFLPGTYQFSIIVSIYGCETSDSAKVTIKNVPGFSENEMDQRVRIQPNPAHSEVVIQFTGINDGECNIEMNSIEGKCVLKTKIRYNEGKNNVLIPLYGIEQGIYFIRITADQLEYTSKLIIN